MTADEALVRFCVAQIEAERDCDTEKLRRIEAVRGEILEWLIDGDAPRAPAMPATTRTATVH